MQKKSHLTSFVLGCVTDLRWFKGIGQNDDSPIHEDVLIHIMAIFLPIRSLTNNSTHLQNQPRRLPLFCLKSRQGKVLLTTFVLAIWVWHSPGKTTSSSLGAYCSNKRVGCGQLWIVRNVIQSSDHVLSCLSHSSLSKSACFGPLFSSANKGILKSIFLWKSSTDKIRIWSCHWTFSTFSRLP